ncbi:MAG: TonB-dependent receptor, partial [Alphaproteobacteria bacterium]|nr:TonB-dependent receptor [Alphaproteobacteria bacterium]
ALTYGSFNEIDIRGGVNFTLVPDNIYVRISGVGHNQDGYVSRVDYGCAFPNSGIPSQAAASGLGCQLGTEGGRSYAGGRIAIRFANPESPLEFNFAADYTKDSSEVGATTLLQVNSTLAAGCALCAVQGTTTGTPIYLNPQFIPTNPYVSYATFTDSLGGRNYVANPTTRTINYGLSGTIDLRLGDNLTLKSISAYRNFESQWVEDNDTSPANVSLGFEQLYHHQFSEEMRLSGALGAKKLVEWTLGGYYFEEKTTYPTHQVLNYAGGLDFYGNDPVNANSKAGFLNAVVHLVKGLDVNAGIRYTTEQKTYSYVRLDPNGNPAPLIGSVNGQSSTYSGDHWDWRLNVDYHITSDIMTYASVSTGFKGGGTNPRPFFGPNPFGPGTSCGTTAAPQPNCQLQTFGPETMTAYEIGAKTSFLNHAITLNVAGYINEQNGVQGTLLNCPQYSPPGLGFLCALPVNA